MCSANAGLRLRNGFAQGLPGFARANGLVFLLNAGNNVEEELREVADGESVATINALASELLDDVSEERVDAVGGVEIAGGCEKLGGKSFGIGLRSLRQTKVIRTESFVVDAEHAAMLAAGTDVLALIRSGECGRKPFRITSF